MPGSFFNSSAEAELMSRSAPVFLAVSTFLDGKHGVAVVARDSPWLAGPELFLANGFEIVDSAHPSERPAAADQKLYFRPNWMLRGLPTVAVISPKVPGDPKSRPGGPKLAWLNRLKNSTRKSR